MTDIHQLHIDLLEEHAKEWLTEDGKFLAKWKEPEIIIFPEIMEKIKDNRCLIYDVGCAICAAIIHRFSTQAQHTIESLERRVAELERELKERPVVEHNKIICIDAVKNIFE